MQDVGFVTYEGKLDILGGEGIAIVERQSLTQFKFVHPLIVAHRPGLRQTEGHGVIGHGLDEGVMQGITEPEGGTTHYSHLGGIEPRGRDGHV
jgi:hypothetical protein